MGREIAPHGGVLVDRVAAAEDRGALRERAGRLAGLPLDARSRADLLLLATGAYSPLTGFMGEADYRRVVGEMRLASGLVWSLPITLAVSRERGEGLRAGEEVALLAEDGEPLALLEVAEVYPYDREREAREVFRTTDPAHPGVAALYRQGELLVGGQVTLLADPPADPPGPFPRYPAETRRGIQERGWQTVVGFQTRNPVHRAHEYLQKCALEVVDGLLLHPLVGETKADDIPAPVRLACYRVLLEGYFPKDRVLLGLLPAAMRYAGPREAIFHALVRKNYGCSHFIVGRDHAGVGNYYGSTDAQRIFGAFAPGELGILPLFFEHAFYCRRCGGMATPKTCPHERGEHVSLSGTRVREMLTRVELPPPEYTRPEVAQVLIQWASERGYERYDI
ncbi:MAG TPA: sulfate adenylyltransferase [Candidatus Methylomirabilis sp.]|jgi:ATP sulfurylase|nr:sulfate adenylyltransferase [Candidatus Methylomirabilis sp.]